MIDTHSHLYDPAFDADRHECVARDRAAGVRAVMLPAVDSSSFEALWAVCRTYPGYCYPMAGLHPTSVNDNPRWRDELDAVARILKDPPAGRIYGVGEVGLDLYWSGEWRREQIEAFEVQIELSLALGLPLAIHTREAWPDMHDTLGRYAGRGLRGVMHAFSGGYDDYSRVKEYGDFLFGIGGVVTYKKSDLPNAVARIPLDDMVLESDAPYLPPVPYRGKRNESGYISHTCARIAQIKGIDPADVAGATTLNAKRMFGI